MKVYIYIFRAGSLGVMESAASGILFKKKSRVKVAGEQKENIA